MTQERFYVREKPVDTFIFLGILSTTRASLGTIAYLCILIFFHHTLVVASRKQANMASQRPVQGSVNTYVHRPLLATPHYRTPISLNFIAARHIDPFLHREDNSKSVVDLQQLQLQAKARLDLFMSDNHLKPSCLQAGNDKDARCRICGIANDIERLELASPSAPNQESAITQPAQEHKMLTGIGSQF